MNLCPLFSFKSFTFLLILLNFLTFLASLIYGGFQPNSLTFLAINTDTLVLFGLNSPYFIRFHYQILRLFTSLFLSTGSLQLLCSSLVLMVLGSNFEFSTSWKTLLLVYFVGGFAGELFSDLFTDYPTIGNSSAIFAVFGALLSKIFYLGLTNENMRSRREIIVLLVLILLILTMIIMIFPISQGLVLIGGFFMGIVYGFYLIIGSDERARFRKYTKIFCGAATVGFFNFALICFFLTRRPVFYSIIS